MSGSRESALAAAGAGALFGASAGGAFAAAELVALAWVPDASGVPPPVRISGAVVLASAWIVLAAAAGALLTTGTRRWVAAAAPLAVLPVAAAQLAHLVAFSIPQPRLAIALLGGAGVLVLALSASTSRERAQRLRFAVSPFAAALLLVGLAVLELDLLRHDPVWKQAAAGLGLASLVLGAGEILARWRPRGPAPRPGRRLAAALGLLALALASSVAASRPASPRLAAPAADAAGLPPIVLVTLDTVRSDHLSVYGYERETSPRLAAFAQRATLFRRAIAASDLTLSTHASLFTGHYTRQHGARVHAEQGATAIAAGVPVLAERLRARGYLNLGVVANAAYLAARYGFDRGFHHYDDRRPPPPLPEPDLHLVSRSLVRALRAFGIGDDPFGRAETAYRRAGEINREVISLLDRPEPGEGPFFLFVNYMDAHWPYDPPPPFDRRFPGRIEDPASRPDGDTFRAARTLARPLSDAERRHMVSQYDGGIAYVDGRLGELLDALDARGLLDPALVVITSDHGEAFGEHGLVAHGVSVYQNQVHVPLLVKRPGQREPEVSDRWASSVDLVPTVQDLLGDEASRSLPGRSWLAADPSPRPVFAESYPDRTLVRSSPRFRRVQRAIFSGDHKLVVPEPGRAELYDLSRDPHEERPAALSAPPGPRLASAMETWMRGQPAAEAEAVPVDDATAERLRALGYAR